jgi:hypothetical protein
VLAQRLGHGRVEIGADVAGILDEAEAVDQLEVGDPRRRADRMRGIGPAMADGPNSSVPCSSTFQTFSDTIEPDSGA